MSEEERYLHKHSFKDARLYFLGPNEATIGNEDITMLLIGLWKYLHGCKTHKGLWIDPLPN